MKVPSFLASVFVLAITSVMAQPTNDMLQRKWAFIGVEEFSVVHRPDSAHRNDVLDMKSDGTYEWIQGGIAGSGTWKLNEANRTIQFTDSKTKKSLTYNLKGISVTDLTLEYQSPDLVRTRYRYQAMK